MPPSVGAEIAALDTALDAQIPVRTNDNVLIATWNLRALGGLTESWAAGPRDSPKRDWRACALIAAILSRFDVVALQEVRRETEALRFLLTRLGPNWRAIASDVTEGDPGNDERLAFVYNSDRVQPSGLIGEIVLPDVIDKPAKQFARTPYAASFVRSTTEFILTTVHVLWGARPADRLPELVAFAEWMRAWALRPKDWNGNLLVLGDFNLDRVGDPLYEAFLSTGLWPPTELGDVPRTIFDNDRSRHFYDQIAWFSSPTGASLLKSLVYVGRAGHFDFVPHAYKGNTRTALSWRISDHYPLWAEFRI